MGASGGSHYQKANMDVNEPQASSGTELTDRRQGDRRKQVLRALVYGSFRPRRRGPRRATEGGFAAVDWHHPQWLAISMLIVLLSCCDAFLTLMLMQQGAYEVNPLMRPLVGGSGLAFALVKVCVTAGGVLLLTQLARVRAFGGLPVGVLLYTLLAVYAVLIFYEFRLLHLA
jgi:Domain of unknown function (DUF5658)